MDWDCLARAPCWSWCVGLWTVSDPSVCDVQELHVRVSWKSRTSHSQEPDSPYANPDLLYVMVYSFDDAVDGFSVSQLNYSAGTGNSVPQRTRSHQRAKLALYSSQQSELWCWSCIAPPWQRWEFLNTELNTLLEVSASCFFRQNRTWSSVVESFRQDHNIICSCLWW